MSQAMFATQMGFNQYVLSRNLEGIGHEESLVSPAGENCLNWVLGHVLVARNQFLVSLGASPFWSEDQYGPYVRGSEPLTDPAMARPLEELVAALESSHEAMVAALGAFDEERWSEHSDFSPAGNPSETIGSLVAGLIFHEAYHAGQAGMLRRSLGFDGVLT